MEYEKSCGAVVYKIRYGRVYFLVEHMKLGHISIPKGHMEGDETEEKTAIREIREETNLEVKLDTVFRHDVYYSPCEGVKKQVIFFVAEAVTEDLKNQESEVSDLEWLPYDQAIEAVTYATDKEVLSHAAVYLYMKYPDPFGRISRRKLYMGKCGNGVWYREHAADIHSHVIWSVDDGSQTENETMELLTLAREEGLRVVFATPHYGIENGYAPDKTTVSSRYQSLSESLFFSSFGIKVKLGNEWYCSDEIVDRIRRGEAYPMNDTDWYMVEFLEWGDTTEPADVILSRLKKMKDNGIKTILAHPERYTAIQHDWNLAKRICDLGVLLQVNAYDLFLNKNDETRNLAQWMAKEEMISFIGSDMHGRKRPPKVKEGINWLYENVDYEYANAIVRVNAEKYLGVERLPVYSVEGSLGQGNWQWEKE